MIFPYKGGKRVLSPKIAAMIDRTPHTRYGEVFAGSAKVFFSKQTRPNVEGLNDINRDIACLFRVLQERHNEFIAAIEWRLTSREEYNRFLAMDPDGISDVQRAVRFLYLQKLSFGGRSIGRTFGAGKHYKARFDPTTLIPILKRAHARLARVHIECLPWQTFVDA